MYYWFLFYPLVINTFMETIIKGILRFCMNAGQKREMKKKRKRGKRRNGDFLGNCLTFLEDNSFPFANNSAAIA